MFWVHFILRKILRILTYCISKCHLNKWFKNTCYSRIFAYSGCIKKSGNSIWKLFLTTYIWGREKKYTFCRGGGGALWWIMGKENIFFIPLIRWFAVLYKDMIWWFCKNEECAKFQKMHMHKGRYEACTMNYVSHANSCRFAIRMEMVTDVYSIDTTLQVLSCWIGRFRTCLFLNAYSAF